MIVGRTLRCLPVMARRLPTAAKPQFQAPSFAPAFVRPLSTSRAALGHNLEDHFDMAEYMCKIHSNTTEYVFWILMGICTFFSVFPLLHCNFYFTGRWLP